jgi:hypothetical protein
MEKPLSPHIDSFVIRFVFLEAETERSSPSLAPAYRGSITHVQSDQELVFNSWQDAVEFIQRFVPVSLEGESGISPEELPA